MVNLVKKACRWGLCLATGEVVGEFDLESVYALVEPVRRFVKASFGHCQSPAILLGEDGSVWSIYGSGDSPQPMSADRFVPTRLEGLPRIVDVCASCGCHALAADGTLYSVWAGGADPEAVPWLA